MIERATSLHFEITLDDRLVPMPVLAAFGEAGGTPETDPLAGNHGDPALRKHLPGRFPDCWHIENQVAHLYGLLLPEVRQQRGVEGVDRGVADGCLSTLFRKLPHLCRAGEGKGRLTAPLAGVVV